ncbi:hypothetical protein [Sulfurovum sp.]|uniref:hypothetical protein n=1 Tax=Sulfurovum sp. TaxID=1969726 RepID=UPI0028682A5F|nr:hypothetical protein [Sulfurovum sp.]
MRLHLTIITLAALGFSGCTSSMNVFHEDGQPRTKTSSQRTATTGSQEYIQPSPEKKEAYENTMRKVASSIKDDQNYSRIALDTPEKKAWFKSITYRLWDRQMTREQFMAEGLSRYPTHKYEFDFIINGFGAN